jgi:Protein of unknown function (DUF3500)
MGVARSAPHPRHSRSATSSRGPGAWRARVLGRPARGRSRAALWTGPIDPGRAHYYRIHGPTVLIELDNTQNDANHIHSVWHDPRNDFGADLLRAHYERGHRHLHA